MHAHWHPKQQHVFIVHKHMAGANGRELRAHAQGFPEGAKGVNTGRDALKQMKEKEWLKRAKNAAQVELMQRVRREKTHTEENGGKPRDLFIPQPA